MQEISKTIRLGTRGSQMALVQTGYVAEALKGIHSNIEIEIVILSTQGDRKQGTKEASCGDKRDWIHDLDLAIEDGSIDIACHSAKDVPIDISSLTEVTSVLPRSDARDALITKSKDIGLIDTIMLLDENSVIGTASARRKAQILNLRPDITMVDHRGNVPTRLRKLKESETLNGIILATCGLERVGIPQKEYIPISIEAMLPAVNQGMLCLQYRKDNAALKELVSKIVDKETQISFEAERACIEGLGADCHSAVGVYCVKQEDRTILKGEVLSVSGDEKISESLEVDLSNVRESGLSLAKKLIAKGADKLLNNARNIGEAIREQKHA